MTARGAGQPRHLCIERPYGELTPLASLETKLEQHTLDPLAIASGETALKSSIPKKRRSACLNSREVAHCQRRGSRPKTTSDPTIRGKNIFDAV